MGKKVVKPIAAMLFFVDIQEIILVIPSLCS